MSDHSNAQVVIYDCPPEQRAAIVEILAGPDYWMGLDWEGKPDASDELAIGETYGDNEGSLDTNETPGATFVTWVDPAYEYSGALTMYAPDLGRFDSACDADGNPTITAYDVRGILADLGGILADPAADLREQLEARLGLAWEARLTELRAAREAAASRGEQG